MEERVTFWNRLHRWPWWTRWPAKLVFFVIVLLLVLYPRIWLLPRTIAHVRNSETVIQPDEPRLGELEALVRARAGQKTDARELLPLVEQVVYERIPYAWDWDVWGVMDYVPTTAEVLAKGREDCDGRAVLAAALLRRMGCQAWLASDLEHMWVATPAGETMSPGEGEQTIQAGPEGTRVRITYGLLTNLARSLTYGIAVFPLTRELIILAAFCAVALQPRSSSGRRVAGCMLFLLALSLLRDSGAAPGVLADKQTLTWMGLAAFVAGWLTLAIRAGGRRSRPPQPE